MSKVHVVSATIETPHFTALIDSDDNGEMKIVRLDFCPGSDETAENLFDVMRGELFDIQVKMLGMM